MSSEKKSLVPNKSDGMPDIKVQEENKGKSVLTLILAILVPLLIGFGIANLIFFFTATEKYRNIIKAIAANDGHWVYFAAVIFGRTVVCLNMYPAMFWKPKVMLSTSKNLRSNPFVYKMIGENALPNKIIFEDEGALGGYNRANRSVHHFVENAGPFIIGFYMAGYVFGVATFVLVLLFCVGRIWHQVGYTTGYGGHGGGFALSALSTIIIEGLLFIVVLVGFGAY